MRATLHHSFRILPEDPAAEPDWRGVLLADPCAYCGAPSREIDHVHPRAHGGTDDPSNLIGACASCNRSKGANTMLTLLAGERIGHARRAPARSPSPEAIASINAEQRWKRSSARAEWLYQEWRFRRAFERKWGTPAPRHEIPPHLVLEPDEEAA